MVTNGNWTDYGGHFEMYRNTELLLCEPRTNIALQVNYTSKSNKLKEKEIRFVVNKGRRWLEGELD